MTCNCDFPSSPILVDLDGQGFRFTEPENGVFFDIDGDGEGEFCAWTAPGQLDAFLVLDRDGNGAIDSGAELFGDTTAQPASLQPNGFEALRVFDTPQQGGNGDGVIDASDLIFEDLRLWLDSNHDGRSEAAELLRLTERDIVAIDLDYRTSRSRDRYGNEFRYASRVHTQNGGTMKVVDVFFRILGLGDTPE